MRNYKILTCTLVFAVIVLTVSVAPAAAQSAVLRFDPATSNLSVGQVVNVSVQLDSVTGLYGEDVGISFNPSVLEVQDADASKAGVQIALGSFLKPDQVVINAVDPVQGTIRFVVTQLAPTAPVSGNGVLATITFKAKAGGTSALAFTKADLSTDDGTAISRTLQNGQVSVSGGGPTPTPTPTLAPGVPTPTPTGTRTPTPTSLPPSVILGYHTVRYGETLFCIGRAYSVSPWAIASQNGVGFPYYLRVGQRLAIPNVPWRNSYGPVCQRQFGGNSPPPPPTCRATYVVRYGDTLLGIARRYGTTAWAIAVANNLLNPNLIFPGQVLCIP